MLRPRQRGRADPRLAVPSMPQQVCSRSPRRRASRRAAGASSSQRVRRRRLVRAGRLPACVCRSASAGAAGLWRHGKRLAATSFIACNWRPRRYTCRLGEREASKRRSGTLSWLPESLMAWAGIFYPLGEVGMVAGQDHQSPGRARTERHVAQPGDLVVLQSAIMLELPVWQAPRRSPVRASSPAQCR